MKKIVQILLFIISYSPLYLILLFQNLNDSINNENTNEFIGIKELLKLNTTSISFFLLIIISISLYFLFFNIVLKSSSEKHSINKLNKIKEKPYFQTLTFAKCKQIIEDYNVDIDIDDENNQFDITSKVQQNILLKF